MASRPQDLLQLLTRAERLSVRRVQSVLDEFDCSVEAWRVLALLSEGGHHMSAIADCTSMPAPTLTKLVDQLVDQNLVYRRIDPADRRRVLAYLTPRGMERWQRLDRQVRADWPELGGSDDEELRTLLARLADALEGGATTGRGGHSVGRAR
ncbi:MarR family transcriptional regulator [Streptomyces sp. NBC_00390]|uniref:MarR family winged helix-turn-helix transcriptional regulator n=1 Tax=Streptomyces sp. NBC_00390 TaxID=2975736 RepID=UPI002E1E7E67